LQFSGKAVEMASRFEYKLHLEVVFYQRIALLKLGYFTDCYVEEFGQVWAVFIFELIFMGIFEELKKSRIASFYLQLQLWRSIPMTENRNYRSKLLYLLKKIYRWSDW
jgi:uncharacterized membrane protein YraQ (UPF0718 family)